MDLRNSCNNLPLQILRTIAETAESMSLDAAIQANNACLAFLLIEDGETIHDNSLSDACHKGHTEIVRLLLDLPQERGVNPASNFNAAIRNACFWGHTEIVRMLLALPPERGVDPSALHNEALRLACYWGYTEIVHISVG